MTGVGTAAWTPTTPQRQRVNRVGKSFGFKTSQWDVDWQTLLASWELGDSLSVFDSGWLFDHFVGIKNEQPTDDGSHEGWTVAAALAARTQRLRFGHLVLGNTYRAPTLLARMATTLDHVAGPRRLVVGLGAGWSEHEHTMFGWELPPIRDRLTMLEHSVQILKGMWKNPSGFSFESDHYRAVNATCEPAPVTQGGPPIWLGTQGVRRGLRIVAEHADGWNANGDFASYLVKREALLRHCDEVGRDAGEIEVSAQIICGDRSAPDVIQAARQFLDAGVDHMIFAVSASGGPTAVQRLADEIVAPLRDQYA